MSDCQIYEMGNSINYVSYGFDLLLLGLGRQETGTCITGSILEGSCTKAASDFPSKFQNFQMSLYKT